MTATDPPVATTPSSGRSLPGPFVAVVGYTLRACLPLKRWLGVLLPCAGALLFGWLTQFDDRADVVAFADMAEGGLFRLILPLTCLVIGDAVLGADARAGTFSLTWLSPVPFRVIVAGRWLGGWVVALVTVVPAMALAALAAGVPDAAGPIAIAAAAGSAAYIALFLLIGVAHQLPPGVGQADVASDPLQHGHARGLLEAAELLGHRGRCVPQGVRRGSDRLAVGDLTQHAQLLQAHLHASPPSRCITTPSR
jgi:hypothetical protein